MSVADRNDLVNALAVPDFNCVVGTAESRTLEFKQAPYDLSKQDQKLELAKDVVGMANGGGGVIVLGFSTRPDQTSKRDVVDAAHPIPKAIVDIQKYENIIRDHSHPPIRQVTIKFWPSTDLGKGAFTISVDGAAGDYPVLVHFAKDASVLKGYFVGVFERVDDDVEHYNVGEIYLDIAMGRQLRRQGFQKGMVVEPTPLPQHDEAKERLEAEWTASEQHGRRRYFLQAFPSSPAVLHGLGLHSASDVRTGFETPPRVRPTGFGLGISRPPEVLPGGGLRIVQRRHCRSLSRSGLLTWCAAADRDFLAWAAQKGEGENNLNPLALIESTYCFFLFFLEHILPALEPSTGKWIVSGGMSDLLADTPPSRLCAGQFHPQFGGVGKDWHDAPANDFRFEQERITIDPGEAAFGVLREVYEQFGLDEKAIPFCDGKRIDPTKFPGA